MRRLQPKQLILLLLILLPLSSLLAIAVGVVNLSFSDVLLMLFSSSEALSSSAQKYYAIVVSIRLPRVLLAALIGALLAASGAAMQGLFRNPLADPSLIGVTAGASLGGSLVIFLFGSSSLMVMGSASIAWVLPLISVGAFIGGLLAVYVVYSLARNQYGASSVSVATMLLAGIAITALSTSLTSLLEYMSDNELLRRISLWRMGGLDGADNISVAIALVMVVIMAVVLPRYSQSLNALLLGESEARHLGVDVESLKRRLIVLVAACVGVSVALTGTISFLGLVVPHIVRLLIGPDHRFLLPASALAGALLLVLADLCARLVLAPTELPVGLVTALIGVPFFVSLLKRRHAYGMG
jgi:iron complex transport system permease protein